MGSVRVRRLRVLVRLLSEPCLWGWEIEDEVTGRVIEGSWTSAWIAYESREEARAAGEARLAGILGGYAPDHVSHPGE